MNVTVTGERKEWAKEGNEHGICKGHHVVDLLDYRSG